MSFILKLISINRAEEESSSQNRDELLALNKEILIT